MSCCDIEVENLKNVCVLNFFVLKNLKLLFLILQAPPEFDFSQHKIFPVIKL